jgi:hypothetical protein
MMALNTTTGDLDALEATNDAMQYVEAYMLGRQTFDINRAEQSIERALGHDRDYSVAVFYRGVIHDLAGTPADAVPHFQRILSELDHTELRRQTRFSLGVAYYHQYSHRWLEKAAEQLNEVISAEDSEISVLAEATAVLAQVHAMWIRPATGMDTRTEECRQHMEEHFKKCNQYAASLQPWGDQLAQVAAPAANAVGMANMYMTDYLHTDYESWKQHLITAEEHLKMAQEWLPRDWANTCDIGSLWLRRGMLARKYPEQTEESVDECFQKAKDALDRVVDELRPDYGFALYELGRLHRYWGKFDDAVKYQDRAMEIPERYRDINDASVEQESEWSRRHQTEYPEPHR